MAAVNMGTHQAGIYAQRACNSQGAGLVEMASWDPKRHVSRRQTEALIGKERWRCPDADFKRNRKSLCCLVCAVLAVPHEWVILPNADPVAGVNYAFYYWVIGN